MPRYAHEMADNGNGSMMVRTLLQWGSQSNSPAIKAAVAQALAALCRRGHPTVILCDVLFDVGFLLRFVSALSSRDYRIDFM